MAHRFHLASATRGCTRWRMPGSNNAPVRWRMALKTLLRPIVRRTGLVPWLERHELYYFHEPRLARNIRHVPRGGIAIDVGAADGRYTAYLARRVGATGRVISIEPSTSLLQELRRRLTTEQLTSRVTLVRAAAGDFVGDAALAENPDNPYGAVTSANRESGVLVDVITIDELVRRERLPRVDVIKIDIEGSEGAALRGAEETLRVFGPRLLLELHNPRNVADVPAFLRERGYEFELWDTDNRDFTIFHMHAWRPR